MAPPGFVAMNGLVLADLDRSGTRARLAVAPPSGRGPAGSAARQADGCLRPGDGPGVRPDAAGHGVQQSKLAGGRDLRDQSLPLQCASLSGRRIDLAERVRDERPCESLPGFRLCRLWEARRCGWNHFTSEVWRWSWHSVPLAFVTAPPGAWLTAVTLVGLAASLGKYGGPLWWVRWGPFASALGPHDPLLGQPRPDHFLPDGTGSPYGLLSTLLPGFGSFRYPSKLLTFMAAGLAVLAGLGWDRVTQEEAQSRRLRRLGLAGLMISLVGLVCAWAARGTAVAYLTRASHRTRCSARRQLPAPGQRLSGPWPTAWSSSPQSWPWRTGFQGVLEVPPCWQCCSCRRTCRGERQARLDGPAGHFQRAIRGGSPDRGCRTIRSVPRPVPRPPNARRLVPGPVRHDRQPPAVR